MLSRGGELSMKTRELRFFVAVSTLLSCILLLLGRTWWCSCETLALWSGDPLSSHNSQHLLDPYSFSHLQHGLLFYAFFWLLGRRFIGVKEWGFVAALFLEVTWEGLENSSLIIDRYRTATMSLGYYGDSIVNSLGDLASCAIGFLLCRRFPAIVMGALFVFIEGMMILLYRDSLLINILMLTFPVEAIKRWQVGA